MQPSGDTPNGNIEGGESSVSIGTSVAGVDGVLGEANNPSGVPQPPNSIDLDRILDEWTCDDTRNSSDDHDLPSLAAKPIPFSQPLNLTHGQLSTIIPPLPASVPLATQPALSNQSVLSVPERVSTPDLAQLLGVPLEHSPLGPTSFNPSCDSQRRSSSEYRPYVFDFNDENELKRIMGKKKAIDQPGSQRRVSGNIVPSFTSSQHLLDPAALALQPEPYSSTTFPDLDMRSRDPHLLLPEKRSAVEDPGMTRQGVGTGRSKKAKV